MIFEYKERDDAFKHIQSLLPDFCEDEIAKDVAEIFTDYYRVCEVSGHAPRGMSGLLVAKVKWVIRDDDIRLAEAFFKSAGALIFAQIFAEMTPLAVYGVVTESFTIALNVFKKGVRLTEDQCSLLIVMKQFDISLSREALANSLRWSLDEVDSILLQLGSLETSDGSIVSVVAQDNEGLWRLTGV